MEECSILKCMNKVEVKLERFICKVRARVPKYVVWVTVPDRILKNCVEWRFESSTE